jgi:hypothetical protein
MKAVHLADELEPGLPRINTRKLWSRILITVGGIAMLLGSVDPMEGSLLILPGSGLVTLGLFIAKAERRLLRDWVWVFSLIAVGVGALFGLSAIGGIGGKSGHSMWWGLAILPYPIGWVLALVSAIFALIRRFKPRQKAQG